MHRNEIDPESLTILPHHLFHYKNVLLTSGDYSAGEYNTMTIGWGGIGTMWSRPSVMVFVRPSRFTYEFMEKSKDFTLTTFPRAYNPAIELLGTKSGRDGDKIAEAGLTPIASIKTTSPGFDEAELIIECVKLYWQDLAPEQFLDSEIFKFYTKQDFHRFYIGEIVHIAGTADYNQPNQA